MTRRETEQMAAIADHRQGSTASAPPRRSFTETLGELAFETNNRLARAIDASNEAQRVLEGALTEQQQALTALAAVAPGHDQVERGRALSARVVRR